VTGKTRDRGRPARHKEGMSFVVFEGLDAAGKSTLIHRVKQALDQRDQNFICTQDPGSTETGLKLRDIILAKSTEVPVPKAELLMYQAARVQMVDQVIRPALQQKKWVLADRFYSSTLAFQVHARELDGGMVHKLNDYVSGDCHPDLFIFVDITVKESQRRKTDRSQTSGVAQDRMESEAEAFQEKVRQGYLAQAKANPEKWLVLDGTETPEALEAHVLDTFRERSWLPS